MASEGSETGVPTPLDDVESKPSSTPSPASFEMETVKTPLLAASNNDPGELPKIQIELPSIKVKQCIS